MTEPMEPPARAGPQETSPQAGCAGDEVLALVARLPAAFALVAIDGHSAAGKSSLAKAIQAACSGTSIVPTDDFYRPMDPGDREALDAAGGCAAYYDWQRLQAEVLRPLRSGRTAHFRRYDWGRNALGDWATVAPSGLVIVEGCYGARPELRAHYDAIILVVAPVEERERRQRIRDDASEAWLARWDAAERWYFEHLRPQSYADLVVRRG